MPSKSGITLSQNAILATASDRRHGHVLPLSDDIDAAAAKPSKLLKSMLAAGLIEERPTSSAKNAWHSDEQGKHTLLRITEAGRQALSEHVAAEVLPAGAVVRVPPTHTEFDRPKPPGGKLGQVLAAVQSGAGASLGDLVALTGWLPHTVRASLTRLRQGGVPIELIQNDGQKRYSAGAGSAPAH